MATPRQLFHPSLPYPDVVAAALAIPVGVVRLNPVLRFIQHARAVHNAVLICETVGGKTGVRQLLPNSLELSGASRAKGQS